MPPFASTSAMLCELSWLPDQLSFELLCLQLWARLFFSKPGSLQHAFLILALQLSPVPPFVYHCRKLVESLKLPSLAFAPGGLKVLGGPKQVWLGRVKSAIANTSRVYLKLTLAKHSSLWLYRQVAPFDKPPFYLSCPPFSGRAELTRLRFGILSLRNDFEFVVRDQERFSICSLCGSQVTIPPFSQVPIRFSSSPLVFCLFHVLFQCQHHEVLLLTSPLLSGFVLPRTQLFSSLSHAECVAVILQLRFPTSSFPDIQLVGNVLFGLFSIFSRRQW